jgi:hypothetical protein
LTGAALGTLAVAEVIITRLTARAPVVEEFSNHLLTSMTERSQRKGIPAIIFSTIIRSLVKNFSSLSRPESVLLSRGLIAC